MDRETKSFIDLMFEKSKEDPFTVSRDDIVRMLSMDPSSEEFGYLGSKARELARIRGNVGSVGIAFGLDYRPCKGNCVYCSFGEKWGLMNDDYEIPVDDLISMISERFSKGFRRFTIRTTEYYSIDRLCEIAKEIRSRVPGKYGLSVNTGELTAEDCEKLYQAGYNGAYHTLHLREGKDTVFPPETRLRTMRAIKESKLNLSVGVDPIGIEHTNEEIADLIIALREFEPVSICSMKRINPKGTPIGDLEEVSDLRIAQVAAVLRFATGSRNVSAVPPNRIAMRWGAGGTSIGTGANPRDSVHDHSTVGKWRFDQFAVANQQILEGYDPISPAFGKSKVVEKDGLFIDEGNILPGDFLKVGDTVDDFTLESTKGVFTLSERVKQGPVLFYFYVINYGKTCTDYIGLMDERADEFKAMNVSLVHVNNDTVENHHAWVKHTGTDYEHLSDKYNSVSKYFGCIVRKARSMKIMGNTDRGFVLIDKDMRIRYIWHAGMPNDTVPIDELIKNVKEAMN